MKNDHSKNSCTPGTVAALDHDQCSISGVRVDSLDQARLFAAVDSFIDSHRLATVMYANVHVLNTACRDSRLRAILNASDIVYCDGAGVVAGARLLGKRLSGRMTGADWIYPFCSLCRTSGKKVFILAGSEGVADQAAQQLRRQFPGISIVGTHHGYLSEPSTSARAVRLINEAQPDIVFVGMGTPVQERWTQENRSSLDAPVVWAVGALFDFVAGIQPRGPRWMLDNGLEWLCRFASDPRRLWRRYLLGNPLFMMRVASQVLDAMQTRRGPQPAAAHQ